jgi:uncharacterized protein (TIGR03067 family)
MFTWAIVGTLIVCAPALKVERKSVKPPAGEWVLEWRECDGCVYDHSGRVEKDTATFSPTQWKMLGSGKLQRSPERAAWFDTGGKLEAEFWTSDPAKARKAIWKVEGDTLTICVGDDIRPTEYTAPKDSRRTVWVFRRNGE